MYITEIKIGEDHWSQVGHLQSSIRAAYKVYQDLIKYNKHFRGIPYRIRKIEGESDVEHTLHGV